MAYDYACGVLSAGMPVLFQRVACEGQANVQWVKGKPIIPANVKKAECANFTFTHFKENETEVSDVKISERWGGTFGNSMSVKIYSSNNTYKLEVRAGTSTLLEKVNIITFNGSEDVAERKAKFIDALNQLKTETVIIEVLCATDPDTGEYIYDDFAIPSSDSYRELAGGTDIDTDTVIKEIPTLYTQLKDKILYSPKFITSGGYTDSPSSSEIGDAMKQLTLDRQDCRALIDLPLGTVRDLYQTEASKYSYAQQSGSVKIPSASMLGPWLYMDLGESQKWLPPSFVYLTVVGSELGRGGHTYTPKAGLVSGRVSNVIEPEFEIGSDISNAWQQDGRVQINPIMRLQSGAYTIAGNSTLLRIGEDEVNAFSESSVDLAIIEIRRFVFNLGTELQYQYNSVNAFEKFSISTANFLNGMRAENTIYDYAIYNVSTDDDPRTLKIQLDVWVTPTIKAININLNVAYGSVEVSTGGEE